MAINWSSGTFPKRYRYGNDGKILQSLPTKRLRKFSEWTECTGNTRKEKKEIDGAKLKSIGS